MYNDTLNVNNKIISYNDLLDIFNKMHEDLEKYRKIHKSEELRNRPLDYKYQVWSFKDSGSSLVFYLNFYDNTEIKFDNYNNFVTIFNNRLEEIKSISVRYSLNYSVSNSTGENKYHHQYINMYITEKKIDTTFSFDSNDKKMDEVYNVISSKFSNAPEKYDDTIRKKSSIIFNIGIAMGFIPALIICTLLLFVPTIRSIFCDSYVLYPICCLLITFLFGNMLGINKMNDLYKNIVPEKKYVSYERGYKDDIEKYTNSSEILIGKNIHNLENRQEILKEYNKYKKFIPYEIIVLISLSLIVIIIGLIF